eukprot:6350737-Pyramimonas_sp.AAC.1
MGMPVQWKANGHSTSCEGQRVARRRGLLSGTFWGAAARGDVGLTLGRKGEALKARGGEGLEDVEDRGWARE